MAEFRGWRHSFALFKNNGAANKSLDASGGSAFLNLLGGPRGALIRAAASTQPLCFSEFRGSENADIN
jgi:hypothetical protein